MLVSREKTPDNLPYEVTLLGVSAAMPAFDRHPSAQLLRIQEKYYLIDCGEGTQMQLRRYALKWSKINQIFISHLHGDHFFGLIGLLNSYGLAGRTAPLDIFGPDGLEKIIMIQLRYGGGNLPYPLRFHRVDCTFSSSIYEDQHVRVYSIPLGHRIPTSGFLFREKERPRNMIGETISTYQIPYSVIPEIKAGADFELPDGRIIPNANLTIDPPAPRSYAYCSDTQYTESIIPIIDRVDLLYHESTFCADLQEQAKITMHSTAFDAASIAKKAKVKKLLLGHYSSRYRDIGLFETEARTVFDESYLGEEGKTYRV